MINLLKQKMKNKRGFSLIELIIVVVIIGVLVAIAIPSYNQFTATSRTNADLATAKVIANAVAVAIANNDIQETAFGTTAETNVTVNATDAPVLAPFLDNDAPTPALGGTFTYSILANGNITVSRTGTNAGPLYPAPVPATTATPPTT